MPDNRWPGPIVRTPCGRDVAVSRGRVLTHIDIWCGHKDVEGLIDNSGVRPLLPVEVQRCGCR